MLRSIATSSAPSDAGAPSHALVPQLATSSSVRPRSIAILRAIASAIGLRQVLPVQTKRIFTDEKSGDSADQSRNAFPEHRRTDRTRANDARSPSCAVYY